MNKFKNIHLDEFQQKKTIDLSAKEIPEGILEEAHGKFSTEILEKLRFWRFSRIISWRRS